MPRPAPHPLSRYLLLLLFALLRSLPPGVAFGPTTTSCCSLSVAQLEAVSPVASHCTGPAYTLASPCEKCPEGTCRIDKQCHCPSVFLNETKALQDRACTASFDDPWPVSIGKADISFRACNVSHVAPRVNSPVCCFSSEFELLSLRGLDPICPLESYEPRTFEKCNPCPPGRCIHGASCICPEWALGPDNGQFRSECNRLYGRPWPESIGQPDTDRRSCDPEQDTVSASAISCCALEEGTLQLMRGRHPDCPQADGDGYSLEDLDGTDCKTCDPGACRVGSKCFCPGNFLRNKGLQGSCNATFGLPWPKSIGRFEQGSFFNCAVRRIPELRNKSGRVPKALAFATRRRDIEFPRPGLSWIEIMGICSTAVSLVASSYLVWRPLRPVQK